MEWTTGRSKWEEQRKYVKKHREEIEDEPVEELYQNRLHQKLREN